MHNQITHKRVLDDPNFLFCDWKELYSGYSCFNDYRWHPCFSIDNTWYAISHSEYPNSIQLPSRTIRGDFYNSTNDVGFISKISKPVRITKSVSGYIAISRFKAILRRINSFLKSDTFQLKIRLPEYILDIFVGIRTGNILTVLL